MKKLMLIALIIVVFISISGCASIINGNTQEIGISSSPIGATVTIDGATHVTPTIVRVKRYQSHIIVFSKDNYEDASATLTPIRNGWLLGNILFLGAAPLGIIVDFVSGASWDLLPENLHVNLQKR